MNPNRSTIGTVKSWNSRYSSSDLSSLPTPRPIEDVEAARLRPSTKEEFPWLSQEFEPIRAAPTRRPPEWFKEGQDFNRNASVRSTRSQPREEILDLHLIVSDLDYYAGAVHDFQQEEEDYWDEVEEEEEEERVLAAEAAEAAAMEDGQSSARPQSENASYGQIQIVRRNQSMRKMGSVRRAASTRSVKGEKDINLVTWDGPDDPDNPQNWAIRKKWLATLTVSLFTFISPVSSSMVAPALGQVQTDLNIKSPFLADMALSIFILGFALGPLILGPMSELLGRRVVLQLSGLFFFVFNLAAGFSNNIGELIAFRFLSGLGGSAPLGVGGGVLADLWPPMQRGKAMALYSLMPLLGPAVGPIAGGFIAERTTWRWVFWSTSIAAILVQVVGWFYLHETYAAIILGRKKKQLIRITGNKDLHTVFDNPSRSLRNHIGTAFKRPFILLFTQPIVQLLSLYIFYVYGVLYLVLASFPRVWLEVYNETNTGIAGLNYISLGIGFYLGTQIAAKFADRIYKSLKTKHGDVGRSEFRVPLMFPGAIMVPIGLFIYGWSAQNRVFWLVPNIGTAIFAAGNQLVFQNCQTYLVDSYTRFAASAIAATAVFRSLGGFAFPLFANAMYNALGYGWGNSTLAFAGIAVGLPVPCVLWWYGERLRKASQFAAG